jgi:hypothetical protein
VNTRIFKETIAVIEIEQERRLSKLKNKDSNIAYEQWLFTDEPFLNELCLMLLVTLRHQIERELVGLAAQADEGDKEISGQKYQEKKEQLRKGKSWDWKKIENRLKLESYEAYKSMKALRLLANSYKHDPSMMPNKNLLKLLNLETEIKYASLPESDALRKGFASFIGLKEAADWCEITKQFVEIASNFLAEIETQTKLSKVNWGAISFDPKDALR